MTFTDMRSLWLRSCETTLFEGGGICVSQTFLVETEFDIVIWTISWSGMPASDFTDSIRVELNVKNNS